MTTAVMKMTVMVTVITTGTKNRNSFFFQLGMKYF